MHVFLVIIIRFVTDIHNNIQTYNILQDNVRDWSVEQDFRPN